MPFALTVSERYRRRGRKTHIVGRLQIPVQWLLEPQDVVRCHSLGEADAAGDVVWRVHVQHQLDARTDCLAHYADARNLVRQGQRPGLQLHRAVAVGDETGELVDAAFERLAFPIVTASRIGEDLGARATQQAEHRQPDRLALQIPERNVDTADRCHDLWTLDARQRCRHAVPAAYSAGTRRGEREQLLPDLGMPQRVHAGDHPGEGVHQIADQLLWPTGNLAEADHALVGAHLDQHDLVALHALMRGPARLCIGHRQRMGTNFGDLHELYSRRGVAQERMR